MPHHSILQFTNELSAKLAARSRHVCVLLGAGASKACGLPIIDDLQQRVEKGLDNKGRIFFKEQLAKGRNLEQILSRLRKIATLLDNSTDVVDDLTAREAESLDKKMCQLIVEALNIKNSCLSPMLDFVAWAGKADYRFPVEIFTTNYDLALERALEINGIRYFDGFIGASKAPFHTELVEARIGDTENWLPSFFVRLWKLHGSINWEWENELNAKVIRLGTTVSKGAPAAIYPSDTKYAESRRVPFVVLQDRFHQAVHQPETLMLISGYSFNDEHINEIIFSAVKRNPRSNYIAFCFDGIPKQLTNISTKSPNLQAVGQSKAILKGELAGWKELDSDQDIDNNLWANGKFALVDFANLARYLAKEPVAQLEHNDKLHEAPILEKNDA